MAQFNEILEGHLQQLLTRRLGMQGGSPAPMLAPEILPALVLENDRPEWAFLKGEQLLSTGIARVPTAGLRAGVRLVNPTGSNAIAVIEQLRTNAGSTDAVSVRLHNTLAALAVVDGFGRRDTRQATDVLTGTASTPILVSSGDSVTTIGIGLARLTALANTDSVYTQPIVLTPGWAIDVVAGTVNVALQVNFIIRVRGALPGELV